MTFSDADSLRLQVLIRQPVRAIRINESSLQLDALLPQDSLTILLQPNTRPERYLQQVRDFLSEHLLGLPGGYPRQLSRWTRLGATTHSVDKLLLLGDPEAAVAVACTPGISLAQAEAAWWSLQTAEVARNLLDQPIVRYTRLSAELAGFLLEHLPFEETPLFVAQTLRLCLDCGILDREQRYSLWQRAGRRNPYYCGFLLADPGWIPDSREDHPEWPAQSEAFASLADNPYAALLSFLLQSRGQKWLSALMQAVRKPTDPDVVIEVFRHLDHTTERYGLATPKLPIEQVDTAAQHLFDCDEPPVRTWRERLLPSLQEPARSMLRLLHIGEQTLNPIMGGQQYTGTVLRKHLSPVSTLIQSAATQLQG